MLVFRLGQWSTDDLLNGHLCFTCDSEGSATHCSRFGVLGIATVGGRRVDGNTTVIAEALEAAVLLFLLRELAICPEAWIGVTGCGSIGCCGRVAA